DQGNVILGHSTVNYLGFPNIQFTYMCNNKAARWFSGVKRLGYSNIVITRSETGTPNYWECGYKCPVQANAQPSYLSTDEFPLNGISDMVSDAHLLNADLAEIRIYDRVLSDEEVKQYNRYVSYEFGIPQKYSFPKNIISMGDSLSSSTPTTNGWSVRFNELDTSYNILKISYPGTGIASVQTNMTNAVVPKRDITRTKDIVDIWIGTNDIASGTETGLSLYNKYIAVHAQARAVG